MESNPENVNTSSSNEGKDFFVEPLSLSEEEEFNNPTVESCGPHSFGRYIEVQDDNFKDKSVKERERCETSPYDLARLCSMSLRRDDNSPNKTGSHEVFASEPSISLPVDQPTSAQCNGYLSSFPSDEMSEDTVGSVETPGKCDICSEILKSEISLKRHIAFHSEQRTCYKCTKCGDVFASKTGLSCHGKTHKDHPFERCDECGKIFSSVCTSHSHKSSHHGEHSKKGNCNICDKKVFNLYHHKLRFHGKEVQYQCETCGKYFPNTVLFQDHLKIHLNRTARSYPCDMCARIFSSKIEFGIFSYPEERFLYHEERYKTEKVMELDHNLPEDHNVQSCLGSSCLLNTTLYLDQIKRARNKLKVYDKREILYKVNKNKAWIDTLPNLNKIKTYMNQQERMLIPTNVSFENNSKQISLDNCLSGIESSICIKEELNANSVENNMCIEENNLIQKDYDLQKILSSQKYIKSTALMKLIKNMISTRKMEISLATNTDKGNHSSQLLSPTEGDNLETNPHSSQIKQHLTLVFKCLGCQKHFSDPYKAKRHIISDDCKQEAYLCEQCGATFFSNEYYQRHKSSHLEKYSSFCKICNKTIFVDTKYLPKKYSENNTSNCPHFSCEVCNKVYHSYASFRNHTRDHKRKSKAKLCEVCGKKTTFLNSHFVNHIKERKFKCMICLKTFLTDSHLQSHFMTHTGYRPVNCNICCNEFRSNNHLKRHQLLHTGGYTSKCNYCNYKFLQNSNFRLHLRTFACKPSSNEKPVFTCSHCEREFSKKMYVISHLTSHT